MQAALCLGASAVAQAPGAVPTDRFGPPACGKGVSPAAATVMLDHARHELDEGARDPKALPAAEPVENFAMARYRLMAYGDCAGEGACYWADLDAQFRRAEAALGRELAGRRAGEKLAMVMDIDETTLTNYCEMRREDFGYVASLYGPWEVSPEAAVAIPGARRLYAQARAAGVAVFFITGRAGTPDAATGSAAGAAGGDGPVRKDETEATARNLEAAGFKGWAGLRLRNGNERTMPTIKYKSEERRKIAEQGYRIVLSVGDQWSDLQGEPKAELSVKLPNPFYFIP
ncbi:MAG TPA: HAD family acid phosphatase [Acidobacteriaceae bacterium]|jgi:hypothetical protein|nr:HAD family acid phosphatase [Acidobacteriaceae bacterium]